MNRLGIFVFYDKEGIVDRYVKTLLEDICCHLSRLVIVCNGMLTNDGRKLFQNFTSEIYVRENTGFDAMAYKLALTDYLGWDEVNKYDEILLFNDTFYGPVYPFSEMFLQMEEEQCDFWGITFHERFRDYMFGTDDIVPAHLHTYFCVYRKSAVISTVFQEYWDNFDSTEWFFSDVCRHEQTFTKVLENGGLSWKAYVDTNAYNNMDMLDANVNPYYVMAYDLIKYHRCPILKRKNFIIKNLSYRTGTGGEDIARALEYIREQTAYDSDLIWENILRLYNIYEIRNALHLEYILPWNVLGIRTSPGLLQETAVVIYIPNGMQRQETEIYLKQIPESIHVQIVSSIRQLKKDVQSLGKIYTYLGIVRLYEIEADKPLTVIKSLNHNLLENMLKSAAYIHHVLELFKNNKRLGVLTVPSPLHANYLGEIGSEWGDSYERVLKITEQLQIHINLAPEIPCLTKEYTFWCKTSSVRPLLENFTVYEDDVLARIYPYVSQSEGYYTGVIMNSGYASLQCTNLAYELRGTLKKYGQGKKITDYDSIFETDITSVVAGYDYVMIYGAGSDGIKTSNVLKRCGIRVNGFVISDDQPHQDEKNGLPIYRLSEVPFEKERTMILVAVRYTRDQNIIMQNLRNKGYEHYYIAC